VASAAPHAPNAQSMRMAKWYSGTNARTTKMTVAANLTARAARDSAIANVSLTEIEEGYAASGTARALARACERRASITRSA
jgi:hypothetical protein